MNRAELWLVRHGETVGQSSTRLYGSTDLALSDVGRSQMECVRRAVEGVVFDRVITSPLQRSREGAAIVHPRAEPTATIVDAFAEIDFGAWEGLTAGEIAARFPDQHHRWRLGAADQDWGFPNGESRSGFRARVASAALARLDGADGRSLLVLHKGVVKVIVGTLLGESPDVFGARPCELGSLHVLVRADGGWRMPGPCAIEHLGEARQPHSR